MAFSGGKGPDRPEGLLKRMNWLRISTTPNIHDTTRASPNTACGRHCLLEAVSPFWVNTENSCVPRAVGSENASIRFCSVLKYSSFYSMVFKYYFQFLAMSLLCFNQRLRIRESSVAQSFTKEGGNAERPFTDDLLLVSGLQILWNVPWPFCWRHLTPVPVRDSALTPRRVFKSPLAAASGLLAVRGWAQVWGAPCIKPTYRF